MPMPVQISSSNAEPDLMRAAAAGIIAALVIAALYFGRPFLVPFALAILLAFALSPTSEFLRRLGLPQAIAVTLTVLVAIVVLGVFGTFIGTQIGRLVEDLPQYQSNLSKKIESFRGAAAGNGIVESASSLFANLQAAANKPNVAPHVASALHTPASIRLPRPIPVEVKQPDLAPFQVIESVMSPLLEPLATLAITIILVVFILLQKEDLRNRFISLAGSRDLRRTINAIDDGAQRLSRYLILQTSVNACVGVIIASGLRVIGVPNPVLWGLIAAIFRFVPYIGIPTAAAIPCALALAVDPGWTMLALTGLLYLLTEGIAGQAVEPWLYGRQMGLSPMAVLLAAAFWTWVWGPVGLLLSTPLTMCVVVLGRHVDQMRFLDTLLGDKPTLSPEEHFYLGMLKGNADEASEFAEQFLKDSSLASYFDDVAVKALALAQIDIDRGALLTDEAHTNILLTIKGLIENLSDHLDHESETGENSLALTSGVLSNDWEREPVLCVAGRGPLDQAAALLLTCLLKQRGIGTRIISPEDASQANVHGIVATNIRAICLSYLEPISPANVRYLVRRLRRQIPNAPLIGGFWSLTQDDTHFLDWVEATGSDFVACKLTSAVDQIMLLAQEHTPTNTA